MRVRIWGTRGSIPTPSTPALPTGRYGGNTTCLSVEIPGQLVILDGGSGLRSLGHALVGQAPLKASFFFSHVHWDHIQGFPFFQPNLVAGNEFDLYGAAYEHDTGIVGGILENALRVQQRTQNFPIQISDLPAKLRFHELGPGGSVRLEGQGSTLTVSAGKLYHPGGCFGYRLEERRGEQQRVFTFATDTEHFEVPNGNLQRLISGADLLAYDAQYTVEEYEGRVGVPRKGWGHSTWFHGLQECLVAGVKRLLLVHHDPLRDDFALARIEADARQEGRRMGIQVDAAREGMEIVL